MMLFSGEEPSKSRSWGTSRGLALVKGAGDLKLHLGGGGGGPVRLG